ncbi:tetratricopeptide repeat-containing sulfotransferase family protein [Pseudohoeflea suaedae]|nr:tetratricopeptide repeat-containing sulfotransferase family protein [Pseudohoeflea suaedae]
MKRRLSAKSGPRPSQKSAELDQAAQRAAAFYQAGRARECEALCRQILAADDGHGEANLLVGILLIGAGRHEDALAFLRKSLSRNRKNPFAHANLGLALFEMGRPYEARESLQTAIRLQPNSPEALANLANLEASLGHIERAVALHQKALALQPGNPVLKSNLGGAFLRAGELEKASAVFRELLDANAADRNAAYGLGLAARDRGDLTEAEASFRKAMAGDAMHADAALQLAWMSDGLDTDEAARMREATTEDAHERMVLDFAISKIAHDGGDYAEAARRLRAANTARRGELKYDPARVEADFEETMSVFDAGFFDKRRDFGHSEETPVFVLGMPRSGTSLVEQILASHPDVYGAGELTTLREIGGMARGAGPQASPPQFAAALSKGASATLGRNYVRAVREMEKNARFIVDKLPGNFMLIGLIRLILPKARIIHCTRDPRETCLSIYRTYFSGDGLAFAYDLDELVHYYGLYARMMDHWHALFGDVIVEANHEKLLRDPEGEIRALLSACDLEFAPQCLDFHKTRRDVRTASSAQVRKPLYDPSKRGWRKYAEYLPELGALGSLSQSA